MHGGPGCMGAGYAYPCKYNTAERVRPRRGGQWGPIMHHGMAKLHTRDIPRKRPMGVDVTQVQQVGCSIYVNGAIVQPLRRLCLSRLNMHMS